uniref:Major facilitator superfamily domain-containing protein 12 n=1 Tax=Lygus hesperus TaxID=30085 RepID=A0A0A9XX79_LYGHE
MVKPSLQILTETCEPWWLSRFKDYQKRNCDPEYKDPDHLPHAIRFGYSMGHVLNDLCASMWFTYSLVFYTAVIGVSHTMAGVIMVIGQVTDAISTPIIGALSDRGSANNCDDPKCGSRKNWYSIGTILIVVSKPFMFSPCLICNHASTEIIKVAYFSFFIIIFQIGWAAVQTVHLAMAVDITPFDKERTFILALRNTMTAICNSATYIGQWLTIMFCGDDSRQINQDDMARFQVIVGAIIIVGLITSVIFLAIVPQGSARARMKFSPVEDQNMASHSLTSCSSKSERTCIKKVLSHWKLHYIGFIYMNTRIFVVSVQALLTLYLHETLNALTYELATVPLLLNTVCFVASLAAGPLNELFGHKASFVTGSICGLGASLWTYFGTGHLGRFVLMYFAAVFYGVACALMQVTAMAMVALYIGEDIRNGAFIYGYMSFLDKISTGITLALILHFHPEDNKNYFTVAVSDTCGISCVLALVALLMLSSPFQDNPSTQCKAENKNLKE